MNTGHVCCVAWQASASRKSARRTQKNKAMGWEEALAPSSPDECNNLCSDNAVTDVYDEIQEIADTIDDNVCVCLCARSCSCHEWVITSACVCVGQMQDVIDAMEARYFMVKKFDTELQPLHNAIVSKAAELGRQEKDVATEHNTKLTQLRTQLLAYQYQEQQEDEGAEDDTDYGNVRIESATFITSIALVSGMAVTNLVLGSSLRS